LAAAEVAPQRKLCPEYNDESKPIARRRVLRVEIKVEHDNGELSSPENREMRQVGD
jgi:hypothetical protein